MKIAILSDTHGNFPNIPLLLDQEIDLLLVAGDIAGGSHHTNAQYKSMNKFIKWVKKINPKQCFITPGNHDFWNWLDLFAYKQEPSNIHCLLDSFREYDGLTVHGTPWTLPFMDWNYMKEDERLIPHWENIHADTDILINHGPAYGVCDTILSPAQWDNQIMEHLGSKTMYKELNKREIPYVFTGHIHSAEHKLTYLNEKQITQCACVSILDEEYKYSYDPLIIDI